MSGPRAALGPDQTPGGDGDLRPGHRAGGGGERERRFKVKKGELGERPEPEEAAAGFCCCKGSLDQNA